MLMLDLCAGLGGASQAMKKRGWEVVTLDIDPQFNCDITADLSTWEYRGPRPDLLWISPPCTEFSRESMPWCRTGTPPDMTLVKAAWHQIAEIQPRYWILENVRGARPYLGAPTFKYGPFYLWGSFPDLGWLPLFMPTKSETSGRYPARRAVIPPMLSLAIARAIEGSTHEDTSTDPRRPTGAVLQ